MYIYRVSFYQKEIKESESYIYYYILYSLNVSVLDINGHTVLHYISRWLGESLNMLVLDCLQYENWDFQGQGPCDFILIYYS